MPLSKGKDEDDDVSGLENTNRLSWLPILCLQKMTHGCFSVNLNTEHSDN